MEQVPRIRCLLVGVWRLANAERIRDAAESRMDIVTEKRFQNAAVRYQRLDCWGVREGGMEVRGFGLRVGWGGRLQDFLR
jgi:hypothetical protein